MRRSRPYTPWWTCVQGSPSGYSASIRDLRPKSITGAEAVKLLDQAGITVNKNAIPYDPQKPMIASGIRIGTPAITTRGLKERDMVKIAGWIHDAIQRRDDAAAIARIRKEVKSLCLKHPMYKERLRG